MIEAVLRLWIAQTVIYFWQRTLVGAAVSRRKEIAMQTKITDGILHFLNITSLFRGRCTIYKMKYTKSQHEDKAKYI